MELSQVIRLAVVLDLVKILVDEELQILPSPRELLDIPDLLYEFLDFILQLPLVPRLGDLLKPELDPLVLLLLHVDHLARVRDVSVEDLDLLLDGAVSEGLLFWIDEK